MEQTTAIQGGLEGVGLLGAMAMPTWTQLWVRTAQVLQFQTEG